MRIVFPTDEQNLVLQRVIAEKMGGGITESRCIAVMSGNELVGVVAFFNYRWPNIECAFYCDDYRWALNRRKVWQVLSYPFEQLKCRRITALVEMKDKRSRRMVQRLGFREEGKLRKAGPKGDIVVYGLLPSELRLKHENAIATASA